MSLKDYFSDLSLTIWKGIVTDLFCSILSCAFYFFSVYFISVLHFSIATSGYIIGFYSLGTIIGGWLGGILCDKINSKKTIIIGLLIQSLGYFLLPSLHQKFLLVINSWFLGCANYISITSLYTLLLQYCHTDQRKKSKVLGLLAMMSNLGLSLSALLIGYFAHYSFSSLFKVIGISFFLLAFFVQKLDSPSLNQVEETTNHNSTAFSRPQNSNKLMFIALFCVFLGGIIVMQYSSTYNIYIQKTFPDYALKGVSYLFALNCALVVILQIPVSHVIQKQNKLMMVGIGAFFQGFSLLMLLFYTNYFYAMFGILISTIGEVIFFPSVQFVCHNNGSERKKGRALGIYRSVYGASRAFGASAGSCIYGHLGSSILWIIMGSLGAICLLVCWRYKNDTK
jgi:predicted MFS family arabinose efflux permease